MSFVPSPPDTRFPAIHVDRKRVLIRGHKRLARRQEVIRQPPDVEKRPLDLRLSSQRPSYWLTSAGVKVRLQWVSLHVPNPFGGYEALARAGEGAGGKESGVRTDEGGVGEIDEGNQCRGPSGVEDGNKGGTGVVRLVNGEIGVVAKPPVLCL